MKTFNCPSCNKQAIPYSNMYYTILWKGPFGHFSCNNCKMDLKLNFNYIVEFFLYYFISTFIFLIIDHFIELKYGIIFAIIGVIFSLLILNYLGRNLFILKKE